MTPITPGSIPAALASSVSICIASAYESLTRTTTSPKINERSGVLICTFTISLSLTPNSFASFTVAWMCLFATITPSVNSNSPLGPTNLQPGVPFKSPDSLTTIGKPILLASVAESSTWEAFLNGPKIDTPANSFLGPTTVTLSAHIVQVVITFF